MAISVVIARSEKREIDELDTKPFTMYILEVSRKDAKDAAGADDGAGAADTGEINPNRSNWTLSRRYSQFDELKNCLQGKIPAVKSVTFPPKVLLGNLKPAVVAQRTQELGAWLTALTTHPDEEVNSAPELLSFLEASNTTVKVGDPTPEVTLTDIHGRVLNTADYHDQLLLIAAASRYNFQKLTEFIKPAQAEVLATFPSARCTVVSVADLRIVPASGKSMVEPVLRKFENKDAMAMVTDYVAGGYDGHMSMESYFVPDYSGDILDQISCSDANWTFRVFVCSKGKVVSSIQSSMTGLQTAYVQGVKAAIDAHPEVAAQVGLEKMEELASKELIKVAARTAHTFEFETKQQGDIVFAFSSPGASCEFEFIQVSLADGSGSTARILPKREYHAAGVRKRICCPAGKYMMVWKPHAMLMSSTLSYSVHVTK